MLADYGFDSVRLTDNWQCADFFAVHKDDGRILKVRHMRRTMIERRHIGKDLHVCFPIEGVWHLVSHDELIRIVEETHPSTLETHSWTKLGVYEWPTAPLWAREKLKAYALDS